jgi:hypothetical protein
MTGETELQPGAILLGWIRDELARTPLFLGQGLDEPLPIISDEIQFADTTGFVVQWPCPYHHIRAHVMITAAPGSEALRVDVFDPGSTPWNPNRIGTHIFTDPEGGSGALWGAYWYVKGSLLTVR